MGWTSLNKPRYQSTVEYFCDKLTSDNLSVLDITFVNRREIYAAVKIHSTQEVIALIYLVQFSKGYHNLSYKDMDETMGPSVSNCPERILKLLTPTDRPHALEWRKRCMNRINRRKNNPKLQRGMVIRFKNKLFSSSIDTFIVLNPKSTVFSNAYSASHRYRIRGFRDREYEVVGNYINPDNLPSY
jgi:hypothetical protein